MSWAAPRTWSVGETLTASNMNTYISGDLSVLAPPDSASSPGTWSLWDSIAASVTLPAASITTPSLSQLFRHLFVIWKGRSSGSSTNILCQFDGDTGAHYTRLIGGTVTTGNTSGVVGELNPSTANGASVGQFTIPGYSVSEASKMLIGNGANQANSAGDYGTMWIPTSSSTVTTITFFPDVGNFDSTTQITVYGIK